MEEVRKRFNVSEWDSRSKQNKETDHQDAIKTAKLLAQISTSIRANSKIFTTIEDV